MSNTFDFSLNTTAKVHQMLAKFYIFREQIGVGEFSTSDAHQLTQ
ncbi:hypothetical protein ADICYQ_5361 [Cyclobacterium qasimii M12-11B]|uniref:Uncharacterized protein n=1 Tax=Cyclobacterium qasimii M12-11B TaxID=641524 RepID=S7WFX5_9BACT|nr:hypothetical protein ADICYQ_5361 [Cyclobacterium qasimii M12-11B]